MLNRRNNIHNNQVFFGFFRSATKAHADAEGHANCQGYNLVSGAFWVGEQAAPIQSATTITAGRL